MGRSIQLLSSDNWGLLSRKASPSVRQQSEALILCRKVLLCQTTKESTLNGLGYFTVDAFQQLRPDWTR